MSPEPRAPVGTKASQALGTQSEGVVWRAGRKRAHNPTPRSGDETSEKIFNWNPSRVNSWQIMKQCQKTLQNKTNLPFHKVRYVSLWLSLVLSFPEGELIQVGQLLSIDFIVSPFSFFFFFSVVAKFIWESKSEERERHWLCRASLGPAKEYKARQKNTLEKARHVIVRKVARASSSWPLCPLCCPNLEETHKNVYIRVLRGGAGVPASGWHQASFTTS